ncbi:carboxymuconolactone decarboxylase family protein [Amycolatopsis albispora]|uniref:Carboxymuconolactone decarboxylase n=1 Tax=Amycolatopsis albispora TaxID=1804986 RepID=A0A344LJV9_9PSEU|nr:carboxymuconolactone decarboxylase family protein [Amycolatopsis albispora]AXB48333.1 carboxymuconolactone decarboxylase [Amycolatopsis albispora]
MTRLPHLEPGELDDRQRELYDAITGGPRAGGPVPLTDDYGRLAGPFNAMLVAPAVGTALQRLGAAIRYETSLSARVRELAILAVAAHWDSGFERYAHEPVALAAGVTAEQLAAVRSGELPDGLDHTELAALRFVRALLDDGDADDSTYAAAVTAVGERTVVELTTLVGYYATLALQLRVFRVPTPEGD